MGCKIGVASGSVRLRADAWPAWTKTRFHARPDDIRFQCASYSHVILLVLSLVFLATSVLTFLRVHVGHHHEQGIFNTDTQVMAS